MARFFGRIGYGESVETAPGVHELMILLSVHITEMLFEMREISNQEKISIADLSVQNSISIVADAYANDHFFAIRYVEWAGALWTVSSVEVQSPRLLLRLGEVYNGPTPEVTPTP